MPIIYDLRKDSRFKEGKEEGKEEQARLTTIRSLNKGILSAVEIAEMVDMPLDFVLKIQKKLKKNTQSNANSL